MFHIIFFFNHCLFHSFCRHTLIIRQQPVHARVCTVPERGKFRIRSGASFSIVRENLFAYCETFRSQTNRPATHLTYVTGHSWPGRRTVCVITWQNCTEKGNNAKRLFKTGVNNFNFSITAFLFRYHTQSPHYFMCANLVHPHDHSRLYLPVQDYLTGTITSSLHRLKDIDNTGKSFIYFGHSVSLSP
jgi:hypothetical protein